MPVILPDGLPAAALLSSQGVPVGRSWGGARVRIALLNLMPDRMRAEAQIARHLASSRIEVELILAGLASHAPRHQADHVRRFYAPAGQVLAQGVDGLIVTGAPVEQLPFEHVSYWSEFCEILRLAETSVPHRLFICWAAQAGLFLSHGIEKRNLPEKAFGVFRQTVFLPCELTAGLGATFPVPVSRHTTTRAEDLRHHGLALLAGCHETGPALAESADGRSVYSFNHFEYDSTALADEYRRDLCGGSPVPLPRSYFPAGDPCRPPRHDWADAAAAFFRNWLDRVAGEQRAGAMTPPLRDPGGRTAVKSTMTAPLSTHVHTAGTTQLRDPLQA